ncbi:MAG: AMP-binding protein [Pseudomonadota bacterium]|nr:AMP-binding protein [Pseudomonadota bacterium]
MHNLTSFIQFHATERPDALAVIYEDQRITYAELLDRALAASGWLLDQDIRANDIVALMMKNSAGFLDLALGASHIGAVLLPVNYRLAAAEIDYIHDHAGVKLMLADDALAEAASRLPNLQTIDADAQRDIRALATGDDRPNAVRRRGSDLYRLMYTSGTTDHPKGVIHRYDNFYWKTMGQAVALRQSAKDTLLVVGPMYHVGGIDLPGISTLWSGGTLVIHREFDPEASLATIRDEKITGAWFAPVMTNMILNHPARGDYDVSSLRWCIGGGERTPETRIREFGNLFTEARYIDAYGLTESFGGDTLMEAGMEIEKIGSTGRAIMHVELDIRDAGGRTLPPHVDGEICLRGPKITEGYWRDAERTSGAFYADDWFRTGDIGYLDEDGFLYLTDRKKDMIISGGENIASSEVERIVYQMEEVLEAAIVGLPDDKWGERVVAVVVPKPGALLDYRDLDTHCRNHLAGFKSPKELHIVDELPRNPSGKVLKRVLREKLNKSSP